MKRIALLIAGIAMAVSAQAGMPLQMQDCGMVSSVRTNIFSPAQYFSPPRFAFTIIGPTNQTVIVQAQDSAAQGWFSLQTVTLTPQPYQSAPYTRYRFVDSEIPLGARLYRVYYAK